MASIYLIRHGQASFGKDNYDELSELGKQQATHLGFALAKRLPMFDAVVLGKMWRHEQTAMHCLSAFGQELDESGAQYDANWNEYDHEAILKAHHPEFENPKLMMQFVRKQPNPKAFFEQEFNAAMNRWIAGESSSDYPETWAAFNQRVHGALDAVLNNNPAAKRIAVFTSGGPISLVSQALLGVPKENIMHLNWTLMNCGVTKIVSTGSRRFVATLNEHTHFESAEHKHLISYT